MENKHIEDDKELKRLFIGISLGEEICEYFYGLTMDLSKINKDIRVIPPQNIHITLKFLGNIKKDEVDIICKNIGLSLNGFNSFKFDLSRMLDGFPKTSAARILFGTIEKGSEEMENLFIKIKDGISKMGIDREEKKFIPHFTLARMKFPINFTEMLENIKIEEFKDIKCNKIILFESILSRQGPEYLIEKEYYLK
ncbi:MAG TPA: RNA 2',3'-cyclic phosphodiesterase [Candidatus Humimicrobiaceae bacterium]